MQHFHRNLAVCWCLIVASVAFSQNRVDSSDPVDWSAISSPIVFHGDATTAYRDPAAIYANGWFYLYFTLVQIDADKNPFQCTAWSKSRDLVKWTSPVIFTPHDRSLNYGSPGDVVRFGDQWVLCLQTYPRPNGEQFGNANSRIWMMRSDDLEKWGPAEPLNVMGPQVPLAKMGRTIDPFLLQDKDDPGKWWCLYKQKGAVNISYSRDLKSWTYGWKIVGGENPCVIRDGDEYVLYSAPDNGIAVSRSSDLKTWTKQPTLLLGQADWPWAQGRLTAGFVLDLRKDPKVGKALMFFHGSQFEEPDPRGGFDNFASVGLAWSSDLKDWQWPGKAK